MIFIEIIPNVFQRANEGAWGVGVAYGCVFVPIVVGASEYYDKICIGINALQFAGDASHQLYSRYGDK
jgi:hypothetical protein